MRLPTLIPSPSQGQWQLGPLPLRAYALLIIVGIVVAWWIGVRRYSERGGTTDALFEVVVWAVPSGIIGARLYHVLTTPQAYFGANGHPWEIFAIWRGGLGIWGSIALGGLGAWIGARRAGIRLAPVLDALAPGIAVAQAVGRLGNWFNQELFGRPTDLPWGLQVSDAVTIQAGYQPGTLFHPTFAYELVWDCLIAGLVVVLGRRLQLRHGRTFTLYVLLYTLGRGFIETLRIDHASMVGPLRFNVLTSIVVGLGALLVFIWLSRRFGSQPEQLTRLDRAAAANQADEQAVDEPLDDVADADQADDQLDDATDANQADDQPTTAAKTTDQPATAETILLINNV
ncbi:MAG: prolipoprotein diacylglyceryl transferase [Bifidobacteriaceae bacterium]|jgi:prolipoprotein diacylglyceryl transferase|nr:prolipoprotein diacylglyceryl transferase [Bifidobacteriaceae bacterium]